MKHLFIYTLVAAGLLFFSSAYAAMADSLNYRNCLSYKDLSRGELVYLLTDPMPKFPGGNDSLHHFVGSTLCIASNINTDGNVFVQFIVEPNGKVSNVSLFNPPFEVGNFLERSIIDAFRRMPYWSPGSCAGKKVAVRMLIPVKVCF